MPAKRIEMDQLIEEQQGMAIKDVLPHMGELFPRPGDRVVAVFSEAQDMWYPAAEAVYSGMKCSADEGEQLYRVPSGDAGTIYERVKDSTNRPILNRNMNVEYIRELMEKRRPRYEAVADICVDTDGKDVDAISEEILKAVEDRS